VRRALAFAAAPSQPHGTAVALREKEVLADYVGSLVMIPSTNADWHD
jgi:hypothetical protein